jgi:hypothetical protein
MTLQLGICEPEYALATFENVYITIWWDQGTVERLEQVRTHRRAFYDSQPGQIASLTVIRITKPKPQTAEMRRVSQELIQEGVARCMAEANVIESTSMVMSAVRMMFATMNLLSRARHPSKVFSNTKDGTEWIAPLAKVNLTELQTALAQTIAARPVTR